MAATLNGLQQYEKAIWYANKSIKLNPKGPNHYNHLGVAYMRLGRSNIKARLCFEKAILLSDEYENAHTNLKEVN